MRIDSDMRIIKLQRGCGLVLQRRKAVVRYGKNVKIWKTISYVNSFYDALNSVIDNKLEINVNRKKEIVDMMEYISKLYQKIDKAVEKYERRKK